MKIRNVVITGANRGIGLELARAFHAAGDHVTAICRTTSDSLTRLGIRVVDGIDLADPDAIANLGSGLVDQSIDILVNNAGLRTFETFDDLAADRILHQFRINALAPLLVTRAFADKLRDGAKVVLVSTRAGSIGDNTSGGEYGYRMSKSALNMAGVNLAQDMRSRGIAVFMLHPGFVKTDLTDNQGLVSAAESAAKLVALTDQLGLAESGRFFHADGGGLPW